MNKKEFGLEDKFYVVGAHSRAQTLAVYLQYIYPEVSVEAYLVNNEEENKDSIQGSPVIRIDRDTQLCCEYPVFIGTRGVFHDDLIKVVKNLGMKKIYPVTVELDMQLRNAYLSKYYDSMKRCFSKIDQIETLGADVGDLLQRKEMHSKTQACVYVAKSIFDKPLMEEVVLADYERIIQVGAALTEKRLGDGVIDSTGEHISYKNKQFCEVTGLYWIWKNALEDIVGLVHYRRHFILPKDWQERMERYGIDVILPVPLYVAPSVKENYRQRHIAGNWDYMEEYLKVHHAKDYEQAKEIFAKNLYSPCNMFIMRKDVLDDLCQWMFPIIEAVVAECGEYADAYQNRYPGFLSERLITLFFEMHRERYKVVYADKNFIA